MTSNLPIYIPTAINLGSGKDFRPACFNIDVDDSWTPDLVLDLSTVKLDEHGITVPTERFGTAVIRPDSVQHIIANDVLEHVPDLVSLMTTCLQILKVGGLFEVSVPYDLSLGAWQDPTHVRSFNERSWLYYTDWFWYLGWRDARFVVDNLTFVPSPLGTALVERKMLDEEVIRTPRAIDSMSVKLRKIKLTPEDEATLAHWRDRRAAAKDNIRLPTGAITSESPKAPSAFAGGWEANKDRFCIWVVTIEGYAHNQAVEELALALSEAFAALGGSAPVVRQPDAWMGRAPIVLGGQLLAAIGDVQLPEHTVLFNLEQVDAQSSWMNGSYLAMLRLRAVVDYSAVNTQALRQAGVGHVRHLAVGYAPGLTRIVAAPARDIDVLFFGSLNERRAAIVEGLKAKGLAVVHLFGVYGAERDASIARAKVVLNLHFYEAAIFEIVRVSYLLANRVCVVSEGPDDTADALPFKDAVCFCRYEDIVERCIALVGDEGRRIALAERGFEIMRARTQASALEAMFDA